MIKIELDEKEVKVIKSGLRTRSDNVIEIRELDKTRGLVFASCSEELRVIKGLFDKFRKQEEGSDDKTIKDLCESIKNSLCR